MKRVLARIELMRPQHWVKNAFVLVGLVFGHVSHDIEMVWAAFGATLAFCLASGAVYAFNDARDAAQDRDHPGKRNRPVARGALSPAEAVVLSLFTAAASLVLAAWVGRELAAIIGVYLALSAAYTLWLKRMPVIDVVVIAAGFMLRLLAGTLGIGIDPSRWLLACGFLLTLFLGFAKRRAEIERLAQDAALHRAVLEDYSIGFLDRAIALCAAGMIGTYAWYTLAAETALMHGTGSLFLTLPWVLLGTGRYLYRLRLRGGGGDPAEELLRDPLLTVSVAGWIVTVLWLIG
ncbi:MAG: decaprenyl-phosphate phosphoribosyltransferase [Betaproteobacteria bacterium]|nr:decaprenyl-phosphate phosphoribosyltransferase [Betaproteobacteria bacterium]